jgi:hypothetical protein
MAVVFFMMAVGGKVLRQVSTKCLIWHCIENMKNPPLLMQEAGSLLSLQPANRLLIVKPSRN